MSDRRLWLEDVCPSCGARPGLRCQTWRYAAADALLAQRLGMAPPSVSGVQGTAERAMPDAKRP